MCIVKSESTLLIKKHCRYKYTRDLNETKFINWGHFNLNTAMQFVATIIWTALLM